MIHKGKKNTQNEPSNWHICKVLEFVLLVKIGSFSSGTSFGDHLSGIRYDSPAFESLFCCPVQSLAGHLLGLCH